MDNAEKMALANDIYTKLCNALDSLNWVYKKAEEDFAVFFEVNGDDLPMKMIIIVNPDKMLISLYSPMPFVFSEGNRVDGAIAACVASYALADGFFKYDIAEGKITFKLTASYRDSDISEELLDYMIHCSAAVVDEYNDQFMAIEKGYMDIDAFIAKQ